MFSQRLNWQEYLTQESQLVMTEIMNNDLSVTTSRAQTTLAHCVQFANLVQWVVCNCSCTSCFRVTRLRAKQSGGWFLASETNFPLVHADKTCSVAHPADEGGQSMMLTTHLHLVPRLKMEFKPQYSSPSWQAHGQFYSFFYQLHMPYLLFSYGLQLHSTTKLLYSLIL